MDNVLFICPHWHQDGNVGVLRARRMVRWMHASGRTVTVVCAGSTTRSEPADFGKIITVRDPLGIFRERYDHHHPAGPRREPNRLRRLLAYALFTPDLQLLWALRCRWSGDVRQSMATSQLILSSSPPESGHVLAGWLRERHAIPHVMDMRDGWLDEPMKPLLRLSALQRFREKRLEQRLIANASAVLVTSARWKDQLVKRYPPHAGRIHVLTNAYPVCSLEPDTATEQTAHGFRLLHAGRISSSRPERNPDDLMHLLHQVAANLVNVPGVLTFLGTLEHDEESAVEHMKAAFSALGWSVTRELQVPHERALHRMRQTDVLVLYSGSRSSLPAKFFDYLYTGKPILCICPTDSAVWKACSGLPQIYCVDPDRPDFTALNDFMATSKQVPYPGTSMPVAFADRHLGRSFIRLLDQLQPSHTTLHSNA